MGSNKEKLKKAKKGLVTRKVVFPQMVAELYREYKSLRKRGLKVKGFWFKADNSYRNWIQKRHLIFLTGGSTASNSDTKSASGSQQMGSTKFTLFETVMSSDPPTPSGTRAEQPCLAQLCWLGMYVRTYVRILCHHMLSRGLAPSSTPSILELLHAVFFLWLTLSL